MRVSPPSASYRVPFGPTAPAALAAAAPGEIPPLSIAILIVGSRGDVQPFLPIAHRLASDGHRVRIATHAVFRDFVESHGIEFFPLPQFGTAQAYFLTLTISLLVVAAAFVVVARRFNAAQAAARY